MAYLILHSPPLIATGASAIFLGVVALSFVSMLPSLPPMAGDLLYRAGLANLNMSLGESIGELKAVYFPAKEQKSGPTTVVHSKDDPVSDLFAAWMNGSLQTSSFIITPGSIEVSELTLPLAATETSITEALTFCLYHHLDLARSVSVDLTDSLVTVTASGVTWTPKPLPLYSALGSLISSVCMAVICQAVQRPVQLVSESFSHGHGTITIEIVR